MRAGVVALGMAAGLALAGCESGPIMTPAECAAADWSVLGYTDGAEGRSAASFGERAQVCANAGYGADQARFDQGYQNGLRSYCQPERGFRVGEEGNNVSVTCPADLEGPFQAAYRDGRDLYRARSAWESAQSAISSILSEREDLERKLSANELGVIRSASDAERDRHRSEVYRLRQELSSIDRRLREAEYEARYKRDDYERLRYRLRW